MLDTFGTSVDDVRGFVEGGWTTCDTISGILQMDNYLIHLCNISLQHLQETLAS